MHLDKGRRWIHPDCVGLAFHPDRGRRPWPHAGARGSVGIHAMKPPQTPRQGLSSSARPEALAAPSSEAFEDHQPNSLQPRTTNQEPRTAQRHQEPPSNPLMSDEVIELYKRDVDRTLLRENLKLSHQERFEKFQAVMRSLMEIRQAGMAARGKKIEPIESKEINK